MNYSTLLISTSVFLAIIVAILIAKLSQKQLKFDELLGKHRENKNTLGELNLAAEELRRENFLQNASIAEIQSKLAQSDKQVSELSTHLDQLKKQKGALEEMLTTNYKELASSRLEIENKTLKISELKLTTSTSLELSQKHQQSLAETKELLAQTERDLIATRSELAQLQEHVSASEQFEIIRKRLEVFEEQHELVSAGLYPVTVDFGTPDEVRIKLEEIRSQLAQMVRNKTAAICTTKWTINGSVSEGTKATRHYIRIMLRTFNADADACLDLIRWNNLEKCESRLRTSYEYVNELGSTHSTQLQETYLDLRLKQLKLMHEYKEAVHRHRESLRSAKQAALEERRANREIERARLDAENEERRYIKALSRARDEMTILVGHEREQMLQTIQDLEVKLSRASFLKQRAVSMAQITKAGFVYVVSNIGSFGLDVHKIGMTRRIDPQERVRELGGASVPFHFDVHAMIYSENAPELENAFHKRFSKHRLNLANGRKEFFRISLSEVIAYAKELNLDAEFSSQAEARDFYISNQIRSTLTDDEISKRLDALTAKEAHDNSESDEDDIEYQ